MKQANTTTGRRSRSPDYQARLAPRLALACVVMAAVFLLAIVACILPAMQESAQTARRERLRATAAEALGIPAAYARLDRQGLLSREQAQEAALRALGENGRNAGVKDAIWVCSQNNALLTPPDLSQPDDPPIGALPPSNGQALTERVLALHREGGDGFYPNEALWPGQSASSWPGETYLAAFEPWAWIIGVTPPPAKVDEETEATRERILLAALAALGITSGIFLFAVRQAARSDGALSKALHERDALDLALAQSEHKYRDLFNNAPLGIYQTTRNGRFINANAELAALYGYNSPKELMLAVTSTPDQLYVDPKDRRRLLDLLDANGRVDDFECRIRKKDGRVIWTSRNVRMVLDPSGRCLYNEGFLRDVTARVESEQALRAARDQAQAASLMKTRFLSLVSHETLTPLTSILGFARLAKKKLGNSHAPGSLEANQAAGKDLPLVVENMNVIIGEGERLIAIIQNVLTLADLESGAATWTMAPCPASLIVERAAALGAPLFAGRDLKFRQEISPDAPRALCDREKAADALLRLLANAVKFTEKGSVTLGARAEDGMLALWVADTGPGVPPQSREAIFGAFDQAGDHLTDKPSGVGLGLPIARAIARGHGGDLRLESVPGQGSVFTLLLPTAGPNGRV